MYGSFEWDDVKEAENWKKHQVWFDEAATALKDSFMVEFLDDAKEEERWVAFGMSLKSRLLVVVYAIIGVNTARIISAREATPRERKEYEEGV